MDKKKQQNEDEVLQKSDIETILKVNEKAIELQTETSDQNEQIISLLETIDRKVDKIDEREQETYSEVKGIERAQFKILLLISTGIISLIIQLISLLVKR